MVVLRRMRMSDLDTGYSGDLVRIFASEGVGHLTSLKWRLLEIRVTWAEPPNGFAALRFVRSALGHGQDAHVIIDHEDYTLTYLGFQ